MTTEKFIVYQVQPPSGNGNWDNTRKDYYDHAKAQGYPVRRLAVMPDYEITAARWFNKGDGCTYHTVRLYAVADRYELLGAVYCEYGTGDHWQVTAAKLVNEMLPGVFPKFERASGHVGVYLRDECNIACNVIDVKRKKDM